MSPAAVCDLGYVVPCPTPAWRSVGRGSIGTPLQVEYTLNQCPALTGTQVRFPRQQPRGGACSALGTQMNLFSRLFRVARSYANALGVQLCLG